MKLFVMSIYDKAAEAYMRPFFVPAKGLAVRNFQDEINRNASDNQMHSHPEDYSLVYLGEWDDSNGMFLQDKNLPSRLMEGRDAVKE